MLLGLAGRARNGKSTVADELARAAKKAGLYPVVYDIGGLVLEFCIGAGLVADKKREDLDAEELDVLVRVGKAKREEDPDFWISGIESDYRDRRDSTHGLVGIIPNIRYSSEETMVRRNSGLLIKVTSLNPNGSEFVSLDRDPNHPAETELSSVNADFYLTAKRGESDLLKRQAATLFDYVLSKRGTLCTK